MFFNSFDEHVRKIFKEDIDKYLVISWIIFNTNYQEEYNGLGRYECYFTHGMMIEKFGLSRTKSAKIIEQLVADNFIVWIKKSKNQHEKSIIKLHEPQNSRWNSKQNSRNTGTETSNENTERFDITGFRECEETANMTASKTPTKTADETVTNTLSINISKNLSKNISNQCVYKPLPKSPNVKLTEEQFNNLVQEHGVEYTENIILDLENHIVNGDGAKYTDHNLAIENWIRYRQGRKSNRVVQKQSTLPFKPKPKKQERFTNIAQHNWDFNQLEHAEELLQAAKRGELTENQYQEAINQLAILN